MCVCVCVCREKENAVGVPAVRSTLLVCEEREAEEGGEEPFSLLLSLSFSPSLSLSLSLSLFCAM